MSLTMVNQPELLREKANFWALMVLVLANVSCLCRFAQGALFGRAGERLVGRLRVKALTNILRQRMEFFDRPENTPAMLTKTLALDPVRVPPIITEMWGEALLHLVTVATGMIIAVAKGWQFALLIVACFPTVSAVSELHVGGIMRLGKRSAKAFEKAVRIVIQSIPTFRMVTALGREKSFLAYFEAASEAPYKVAVRAAMVSSAGFALSQGLLIMIYAVSFGFGMSVVTDDGYTLRNMLVILFTIMFTITSGSTLMKLWGEYDDATNAALSVFRVMDAPAPQLPSEDQDDPYFVKGQITFRKVRFAFPTRPNIIIFRELSLRIRPGRLVAIVGATRAGKTALLGMIPRFYDADQGQVEVDEQDVAQWNVEKLRAGISLVEWDADLFGDTIGECLEYGAPNATRGDVVQAAAAIGIDSWCRSQPQGYDTVLSSLGSELDAQRRQLLVLARALVRRPKVLLLDDPTRNLDPDSETKFLEALKKSTRARGFEKRTTLIASGRISVTQHAATIVVMHQGRVVERGNHFDLLARRGYYYALACKQSVQRRVEPWDYMWSIGKKYVQTRSI
ncbi:P-loop containing nucleoside triphosphate hydrolase protein [Thamnocephalis sphaerospora]|uniref:P-loop containing nucleoside triphosphate hydrolase protein n=1 Tax=Thamnocephalis sphaerospora TaxID=78915 RepID=A0A4P9XVJ4_9FUNG|nr:P-loop containing nucleoside triphosphate hydrolase protein [Thamnocephalis sphaerospora]|eukprot:RKP10042.1 P-loop containing nucleoside triphosphate hydrolase protein [Thamnocephalis sphaerospora]